MSLLAIIPARGGSKGIPRKNLAKLAGKPLISYTVEAAMASKTIDKILLSTEDEEIASFCKSLGLETKYRRPATLATDEAGMLNVVLDGLRWFEQNRGLMPEELALLQPTSPLRSAEDIDKAVDLFRQSNCDTLFSVNAMSEHPCECIVRKTGGWDFLVNPPVGAFRRQEYPMRYFFVNGAIYLAKSAHVLGGGSLIDRSRSSIFEMPAERSIDIDTLFDLSIAEAMLQEPSE